MAANATKQVEQSRDSLLRVNNIIGAKGLTPFVPISRSVLWAKVKNGTFPQPIQGALGPMSTCWTYSAIQEFIGRIKLGKPIEPWTYREKPEEEAPKSYVPKKQQITMKAIIKRASAKKK